MTLLTEIGQPTFVEVIKVDPYESTICESQAILGNSNWQNPSDRFDVNGDGVVDVNDYNDLLAWVGQHGQGALPAIKPDSDPWVDVNGDGFVDDKDLQQLSNHLNGITETSNIGQVCHDVSDFRIERDLLDPNQIIKCNITPTIRSAACHKNVLPTANYTPYFFVCTGLLETTWDTAIKTRDSIIYVHNDLLVPRDQYFAGCSDTPRVLNRILQRLQGGIFPHRYDQRCPLPGIPDNLSDWKPPVGVPIDLPEIPDEPIFPEEPEPDSTTTTTTPEPQFGLLTRVVIINILGSSERYLNTESWYANSSSRVSNGTQGFEASGTNYGDDVALWEEFIDDISDNDSIRVRSGIIHPKGTGDVFPPGESLPKDSDRSQINYIPFDLKDPRISVSNIINAFNIITQNGQYAPTLLILVSNVAEDSHWASQISQAAAQLGTDYPRMEVIEYPYSKPFDRWIMMDLDAMYQLAYQRDNVNNTEVNSAYRTNGVEGVIEDTSKTLGPLRKNHIEIRVRANTANVNWWLRITDPSNPQQRPQLIPNGKIDIRYVDLHPWIWLINEQIAGTGSATSRPRRSWTTIDSNPFFISQEIARNPELQFSNANIWSNEIVIPTITAIDEGSNTHVAYAHYTPLVNVFPYLRTFYGGMRRDIRIDAYISSNINDTRQLVQARARGETSSGSYNPTLKYHRADRVDNIYPVTHLDPGGGGRIRVSGQMVPNTFNDVRTGYYVSIWYNDLHAIVTEGSIRGPRAKDHYIRDTSESGRGSTDSKGRPFEERQRMIAVYSDPDFQDKIYDAVNKYYEARSAHITPGRPSDIP